MKRIKPVKIRQRKRGEIKKAPISKLINDSDLKEMLNSIGGANSYFKIFKI